MKKFKPGALVMLKSVPGFRCMKIAEPHLGTCKTLGQPSTQHATAWKFDPPLRFAGGELVWREAGMILIEPGDGTDEMLLITGLPERNGVAA